MLCRRRISQPLLALSIKSAPSPNLTKRMSEEVAIAVSLASQSPGVAASARTVSSCCTPASLSSSSPSSCAVPVVWPPLDAEVDVSLPVTIKSLHQN